MKKSSFFCTMALACACIFSFSSCKDDEDLNSKQQEASKNKTVENDSVFTPEFNYNYGFGGPQYDGQYNIKDINYGKDLMSANGVEDIALNIIEWVGKTVATGAASKAGATIFDLIVGDTSGTLSKLNQLSEQITEINSLITELCEKLSGVEYTNIYNMRMQNYWGIDFVNCTYYADYYDAVEAGDKAKADSVLVEWASQVINTTSAPVASLNYMNMISTIQSSDQKTMPEIYDFWIFQTTPWEHEGYFKRDQLRLGDVNVATAGYLMARAYYERSSSRGCEERIERLDLAYQNFMKFYKGKTMAERHDDYLICQIEGAHLVFNKNLTIRDMYNHPWAKSGSEWYDDRLADFLYGEVGMDETDVRRLSVAKSEAQKIYDYYNSKKTDKLTFEQIMKNVGFNLDVLQDGYTHVMTLNDGGGSKENEHWYNYNYFLRFGTVVNASSTTLFQNDYTVGCMWITEQTVSMTVSTKILKWWDHYCSDGTQYFRTNIDHRYSNMNPF